MTTTLTPSLGQNVAFVQQGPGLSPGYSAIDDRRANSGSMQEGVYAASDFMVVQRAAGANPSVDIGMPSGGFAYVQGDTVAGQGLYTVPVSSATINEAITAADATNPRVDQVILEVLDNVHDGLGGNRAQTRVLTGTATVGATLTNRTGATALPGNALLLADVLVGNGVTTIPNTVIRDRRKWARGVNYSTNRTAGSMVTASTSNIEMDSTLLKPRVECSGAPLRVTVGGYGAINAVTNAFISLFLDGVSLSGTARLLAESAASGKNGNLSQSWLITPAAGSHQISPAYNTTSGTLTVASDATSPFLLGIEEIVRQNTANNTTTTG